MLRALSTQLPAGHTVYCHMHGGQGTAQGGLQLVQYCTDELQYCKDGVVVMKHCFGVGL